MSSVVTGLLSPQTQISSLFSLTWEETHLQGMPAPQVETRLSCLPLTHSLMIRRLAESWKNGR